MKAMAKEEVLRRTEGIELFHDRILAYPASGEEMAGTIVHGLSLCVPDISIVPDRGVVVAVGPGRLTDAGRSPLGVARGDTVVFDRYGRQEIEINGLSLWLIGEKHLHGVLEEIDVPS